ncbi:olfactory receptor 14C36-like [Anser cygnoides]|uniref:olfactory receptor 14C36-like n=1 Tax=Anser cygnoides TaxID=8845 RepID=UPI0034D34CA8
MYFFLLNLALLDMGTITTTVPKAMANSLWDTTAISYLECAAQVFFFFFFISAEFSLLTIMAYDRYIAICKRLHYGTILKLSCSDAYLREVGLIVASVCLASGCFVFLVLSYVEIFRAVLRIPSEQGRHKAFFMCLPYLAVVFLFISTAFFAYLKPPSMSSSSLNLLLAVLYSAVNSLIYSMRNKELKGVVWKVMTGGFSEGINCPSS